MLNGFQQKMAWFNFNLTKNSLQMNGRSINYVKFDVVETQAIEWRLRQLSLKVGGHPKVKMVLSTRSTQWAVKESLGMLT